MNILVIGGSYFYGRIFVMEVSKNHCVTVVNRGTYSMEDFAAEQFTGDRRNGVFWKNMPGHYDVIVDFCGYEPGDISTVLDNFTGRIKQYIFISTVDVYQRGIAGKKTEDTPFETRNIPGEGGAYIAGKVALEQEVVTECHKRNINVTILRPAILYGPYNYAPRESIFIQMAVKDGVLPQITDAKGKFQFVYVKDAVEAIQRCLLNENAYGQAYNLCGEEIIDYERFFQALLKAAGKEVKRVPLTVKQAMERGLPLPFPVMERESELYSNEKSRQELGLSYLSLLEGMKRTYRAFRDVFQQQSEEEKNS